MLICPAAYDQTNPSYELLSSGWNYGSFTSEACSTVMILEINANHNGCRVVCYADGHIEMMADAPVCYNTVINYGTASTMRVDGETKFKFHASPPANIRVRLVAAESPARLVSDLERIASVKDPINSLEDATLWVRGASVDGTNTFERYYKGAFTKRTAELELSVNELGAGEHVIEPGHHVFRIEKEGTISSTDPDIIVDGQTVSLKTYLIEIVPANARKPGILELYLPQPGFDPAKTPFDAAHATNLLNPMGRFAALHIYLPANTVGSGYLLAPSGKNMQAFHVQPGGTVTFQGSPVQGLKAEGSQILLP
jgi:hypothetical protein